MKPLRISLICFVASALCACDVKVTNPPGETVEKKETTIVNPPAEKKVENNTTIVNPPAK